MSGRARRLRQRRQQVGEAYFYTAGAIDGASSTGRKGKGAILPAGGHTEKGDFVVLLGAGA